MESIERLYFEWLIDIVCDDSEKEFFSELLIFLFFKEFRWIRRFELDGNLAIHGRSLRDRFLDDMPALRRRVELYGGLSKPCNVLEVMISLAVHIEDEIMSNNYYGDRTGKWFWSMIESLGLIEYENCNWDEENVENIAEKFLNREYRNDGFGGLFYIPGCKSEMKNLGIWQQMGIWLSNFAEENGEIW